MSGFYGRMVPLAAALVLAACGSSTGSNGGDCPHGESMEIEGSAVCVTASAVVIETGFQCPASMSNRQEQGDFVVCSDGELPPGGLDAAIDEWRSRRDEPIDQPDVGSDTGADVSSDTTADVEPDGSEVDNDGDGFVASEDCDDNDPTVFPGAVDVDGDGIDNDCDGEIDEGTTCSADSDCPVDQVCVDGVCQTG